MANTLLYDPLRGFRAWNIADIWLGPEIIGSGVNVPNIGDLVVDWDQGFFRVTDVATESLSPGEVPSYIPVLTLYDPDRVKSASGETLYGSVSGYQPSIMNRAFYDNTVNPFTISLDSKYKILGSEANVIKLFKGTNTKQTGEVISLKYNSSGNIAGENIDLVRLDPINDSVKRPDTIYTLTDLEEGELVTAVIYSLEGNVVGETTFIVKHSSLIRAVESDNTYLESVSLVTSLLDSVELDLIKIPANVPVAGSDMMARLHYSNGATALVNIDGIKCKLHGLDNFNTSIAGVTSNVILSYYPDDTENVINLTSSTVRTISKEYRVQTVTSDLDHSFKIYVSPKWNASTFMYDFSYYLTNLSYDLFILLDPVDITVELADGGPVDFTKSGGVQDIRLAVHIPDVIPMGFPDYTFVQAMKIELGDHLANTNAWILDYVGDGVDAFGVTTKFQFSDVGLYPLEIKATANTIQEWFIKLYYSLHPIFDPTTAFNAPTPTHFRLQYDGFTTADLGIAEWDLYQNHLGSVNGTEKTTVDIIWLQETSTLESKLILGISPVMAHGTLT